MSTQTFRTKCRSCLCGYWFNLKGEKHLHLVRKSRAVLQQVETGEELNSPFLPRAGSRSEQFDLLCCVIQRMNKSSACELKTVVFPLRDASAVWCVKTKPSAPNSAPFFHVVWSSRWNKVDSVRFLVVREYYKYTNFFQLHLNYSLSLN